jgi:hypothetical protein
MSWTMVFGVWLDELMDAHAKCQEHDGKSFVVKRAKFVESVTKATANGLDTIAGDLGMNIAKHDKKLEIWPAERLKAIQPILEFFDKKNIDQKEASLLLINAAAIIEQKMLNKFGPALASDQLQTASSPSAIADVPDLALASVGPMCVEAWQTWLQPDQQIDSAVFKKNCMAVATIKLLKNASCTKWPENNNLYIELADDKAN